MHVSPLPLTIRGGGVAGLAMAGLLARARSAQSLGVNTLFSEVALVERGTLAEQHGYGFQLYPNALQALVYLGLEEAIQQKAFRPDTLAIYDARKQKLLHELNFSSFTSVCGLSTVTCSRKMLVNLLLDHLEPHQKHIHIREKTTLDTPHNPTSLPRETTINEAIIGAEGLHSPTRQNLWPQTTPKAHNRTAWRTLIPTEAAAPGALRTSVCLWLNEGYHAVTYPLDDGQTLNVVLIEDTPTVKLSRPLSLSQRDWGWSLTALFSGAEHWTQWPLMDIDPLPAFHAGNTLLMGDAAHAVVPHQAQGAAMALEDAATLKRLLTEAEGSSAQWPEIAAAFTSLRRARCHAIQATSRSNGRIMALTGLAARARNMGLSVAGGPLTNRHDIWRWRP